MVTAESSNGTERRSRCGCFFAEHTATLICATVALVAMMLWGFAGSAWAIDVPDGVAERVEGTCHIGNTWMIDEQSFFAIPSFSGPLNGSAPSSAFECLDHTAAAPEDVDADYVGEFIGYSAEEGWVEYRVVITPPGVTDGVTFNELGLIGYQRVGGTVRVPHEFKGGIALVKRSSNPGISDGNSLYGLGGAVYGAFATRDAASSRNAAAAVATYRTDSSGRFESRQSLTAGTYYVAEIQAPDGYAIDRNVYEVTVESGKVATVNAATGSVSDAPRSNPVTLLVAKRDSQTADGKAQGGATLAGALFTVRYYNGYYGRDSLPSSPTRTWVFETGADGKAVADDAHFVSGDELYRTESDQATLPLGTVTVQETGAPAGYLVGKGTSNAGELFVTHIDGKSDTLAVYTAPTVTDDVKRGGVRIGKVDRQNRSYLPQGSATLAGARFAIASANEQKVVVDGVAYANGDIVTTIETKRTDDGSYVAETSDDCLPVGTYVATECETSEGYLLDGESRNWSRRFEVTEDGQMVDLTAESDAAANRVIRGDLSFGKVDGQTMMRLAGVPFLVKSDTTGESHVIVTDRNGMVSTAASWNPHSTKTNANDDALSSEDGKTTILDDKLDPEAGVWFAGRTDAPCQPDDAMGALPFDTYTLTELRCKANEGRELVTFSITVSREGRELDLGTIDDNAGPVIGTSLADDNGIKLIAEGGVATITDTVGYSNLDMRNEYKLVGALHLVNGDGTDGGVVSEATTSFVPTGANGTANVDFAVDTSKLGGKRLVAFEQLLDAEGVTVATHEDLTYEGQTVRTPQLGTTLVDKADGDHAADTAGTVELVDTVSYEGLTPGDAYTVTGTLHVRSADGSDAGIATSPDGSPIRARANFTAAESSGTVEVTFSFDASTVAGSEVVAFEELERKGITYATHADISDEGQTVELSPKPEEPVVEDTKPASPAPDTPSKKEGTSLAKTGDEIPPAAFALIPIAVIGLAVAFVAARKARRVDDIVIERGPERF